DYKNDKDDYEGVKKKLTNHFKPKFNTKVNVLHFRDLYQFPGEPFEEFVTRLKDKAKSCAFGESESNEIATQILHRCSSDSLKRKCLEKDILCSLEELIKLGKLEETVNLQLQEFKKFNEQTVLKTEVNQFFKNWFMPMITLMVCGLDVRFTVDTGSAVNIMDESTFKKLKMKQRLDMSNLKIYGYGQEQCIQVLGKFHTRIKSNGVYKSIEFVVTGGHF
ncbi:hypothetical protein BpHYR1_051846, partial [Brachionus plicatilis]